MTKILNLDDLKDKFKGYTVLAANGLSVALLSDKGRTCSYTFLENEDTVVPERIKEIAVNSVFGEGDEAISVSGEQMVSVIVAKYNAAITALEQETAKNSRLTEKMKAMEEAETNRRKDCVCSAIKEQLQENQRDCEAAIPDTLCDELLTDEKICEFAAMVDAKGCFVGDAKVKEAVDALCMAEIRKDSKAKQQAKAANNGFKWSNIKGSADENGASKGIIASLQNITK